MISQTTLEMVVKAVDQATGPLDDVKAKVDGLAASSSDSAGAAGEMGDAFDETAGKIDGFGEKADEAAKHTDDLGESARGAGEALSGGMVGAITIGITALVALGVKLKEVHDEHVRIAALADKLNLPVDEVKTYDDAWVSVAEHLYDVARGFAALGDAQAAAFETLGLQPGKGASNIAQGARLLAAGSGSRESKIDVMRILFNISPEEAEKELDREYDKLQNQLAAKRRESVRQLGAGAANINEVGGLTVGALNVDDLRRQLKTETELREEKEKQAETDRKIGLAEKELAAQEKARREEQKKAAEEDKARIDAAISDLHAYAQAAEEPYRILGNMQDAAAQALEDNAKAIHKIAGDSVKQVEVVSRDYIPEIKAPYEALIDSTKSALGDMAREADFSFKHLIDRIIAYLLQKKLFDAIDKVGDALSSAFSGGGGGFWSSLGHAIFGKAGGGTTSGVNRVAEGGDGELVVGGINSYRVLNRAQMAFRVAGGTASAGAPQYIDQRQYHLSGVDTAQMIAYFERGRAQDREGVIQMLKDNRVGRMR